MPDHLPPIGGENWSGDQPFLLRGKFNFAGRYLETIFMMGFWLACLTDNGFFPLAGLAHYSLL